MSEIAASLFISTYEQPRHLELIFAALSRQSYRDFEVLICDDGSGAETRGIVERFAALGHFPVRHLWQEQVGFRKCRILNQGLRESRGRICVFLDGDCVPHRDYLLDHVTEQEPGRFLAGRRVELSEKISARLTPAQVARGYFDFPRPSLIWDGIFGGTERLNRTVRLGSPLLRRLSGRQRIDDLKGCNYSVAKEHLLALNGFDEDYEGYGREDTDVEIRLQNLGLQIKSMKGLALQYHVWHPRRGFTPANEGRLESARTDRRIRCKNGLEKLPADK